MIFLFLPQACGILAPWLGIKLTPPALEGKVLQGICVWHLENVLKVLVAQ